MQISKFSVKCPKWALPKEEIPIHVEIAKSVTENIKDSILTISDHFELIDTINITEYDRVDDRIIVKNIGKASKSEYDYFGIVIATKNPFDELKKEIPIRIRFNMLDGTSEEQTIHARIFRPLLEFNASLKNITLTDDSNDNLHLPISLKFTGFGEIKIRSECIIDGKIVSTDTSLIDEILQRLLKEGLKNDMHDNNFGLSIDKEYVHNITTKIKNEFLKDKDTHQMLQDGKIDKEFASSLYNLNKAEQKTLVDVFYKTIEGYFIKIISDILKRNIGNNLHLESETKIHTSIKTPVTHVTVKFFYKDLIDNEYDFIEQKIQIVDKRTNPSEIDVEIPVEITNVDESNAYKNVGSMIIETDY